MFLVVFFVTLSDISKTSFALLPVVSKAIPCFLISLATVFAAFASLFCSSVVRFVNLESFSSSSFAAFRAFAVFSVPFSTVFPTLKNSFSFLIAFVRAEKT